MVRVDARGITLNLSKYILLLKSNIISDQGKTAAPASSQQQHQCNSQQAVFAASCFLPALNIRGGNLDGLI